MEVQSTQDLLHWFDQSTGVTTDSRECGPGKMYFALKGERFDGNQFAPDALQKGCIAAVVDDPSLQGEGILHVSDGLKALQSLARAHRRRFKGPVFGLTGSNGKTTTKELIKAVVGTHLVVHATHGNLNNHIGVPLTLLAMPLDTEFALVEMGANHQGEIAELCAIAEPTLGMITNVGLAHLEGFGGVEGVKKGKQELYKYLAAHEGAAFVPASDPDLLSLSDLDGLDRLLFGSPAYPPHAWRQGAEVNAPLFWTNSADTVPGPWHKEMGPLNVQLPGEHQLANMQAAIAVGMHLEVAPDDINAVLAAFLPVDQRGETVNTDRNRIIVDCYNANPSSVISTLRAFAAAAHPSPLVILGDMKELGEHAKEGHRMVRDVARDCGLECWVVGSDFQRYAPADRTYLDMKTLGAALDREVIENRTILLKGSRSMQMEALVQVL